MAGFRVLGFRVLERGDLGFGGLGFRGQRLCFLFEGYFLGIKGERKEDQKHQFLLGLLFATHIRWFSPQTLGLQHQLDQLVSSDVWETQLQFDRRKNRSSETFL